MRFSFVIRPNAPTTISSGPKPSRSRSARTAPGSTGTALAGIGTWTTAACGTSAFTASATKALWTATAREASTGMRTSG